MSVLEELHVGCIVLGNTTLRVQGLQHSIDRLSLAMRHGLIGRYTAV